MTIIGTFKNINNVDIEVCIYNQKSNDNTTYLISDNDLNDTYHFCFAADGVSVRHNFSTLFEPIITGEASINLVSNIWVGDILYASDLGDIIVYIKKGNDYEFVGFVEPRTYSQPINAQKNEIEVHCIDWLTACEQIKLSSLNYNDEVEDFDPYEDLVAHSNYYSIINTLERCKLFYQEFEFPNNTLYNNLFIDNAVVNMLNLRVHDSLWLGEDEDDEHTIADIITEICKYLNCRIVSPNGLISYMLTNNADNTYEEMYNCQRYRTETDTFDNVLPVLDISDEDISMDNINSQVSVTCALDTLDDVIEQPLDDDALTSPYKNMQPYMSEYRMKFDNTMGDHSIVDKNNQVRFTAFINYDRQYWGDSIYDSTYHDCELTNWYVRYVDNNRWHFNNNFNKFYEANPSKVLDANGNYIRQYYPMFDMNCNYELYINNDAGHWNTATYDYDIQDEPIVLHTANTNNTYIHPYIISVGKSETMKHPDISKEKTPSFNNYLYIPCPESWLSTSTNVLGYISESEAFSWINNNLAKYDPTTGGTPIINYKSNKTMNLSPSDENTTNYILFEGKMKLLPSMRYVANTKPITDKDGTYNYRGLSAETSVEEINEAYSFPILGPATAYNFLKATGTSRSEEPEYYRYLKYYTRTYPTNGTIYSTHNYTDEGYSGLYLAPQPLDPDSRRFRNAQLWQPDVDVYAKQYPYKGTYIYTNNVWINWNLDYIPVLLCSMKVGNKYLKETTTNLSTNRTFEWTTDNTATFTLGFGLLRDNEHIIGENAKDMWNNVTPDINLSDANGTAIPVTKADNLYGDVEFNVIGPFNAIIDENGYYKCYDWFRNTSGTFLSTDTSLLNHLRGIQIEDFKCTIQTDHAKNAAMNTDNDLCYLSVNTGLKTAELKNVDFEITTAVSEDEAYELGISTGISYNNPLNTDGTLYMVESPYKPEEKYVQTLFDLYSTPKKLIEYEAKYSKNMLEMYRCIYPCSLMEYFGTEDFNTILGGNELSLYKDRIKIQLREI